MPSTRNNFAYEAVPNDETDDSQFKEGGHEKIQYDKHTGIPLYIASQKIWTKSSGIPVMQVDTFRCLTFLSWLCAILMVLGLPWLIISLTSDVLTYTWNGPLDNFKAQLSNCDLMFRESTDDKPGITLSYWTWNGGSGKLKAKNSSLHIKLSMPFRSNFFRCTALVDLPPFDSYHFRNVKVKADGSDTVILESHFFSSSFGA